MSKKFYTVAVTVIITAALTFITSSAYYNGRLIIKPAATIPGLGSVERHLDNYYYKDYDKTIAADAAIKGYVASLGDPYTEYMNAKDVEKFNNFVNSSYCGIGVTVHHRQDDNTIHVLDVAKDSPAYNAGIEVDDIITKVEGVAFTGDKMDEAISKIKGKEGTEVTVTVSKPDCTEKELTMKRANIQVPSVASESIDENIGYIVISQFSTNTGIEFLNEFDKLINEKNVKALIIDVRDNPGGITTSAEIIIDCLLPKDSVIYYTQDKYGAKEYVNAKTDCLKIPLVVLANENSASASEILVGAIKDNERGIIVGKKTHGKGVVQTVFDMANGAALKVTTQRYFTPKGNYIHEKGIQPDYSVDLAETTDTQLEKAIEILKNQ